MKEHPYIGELGRFTAYVRTNLPYTRMRRFARNTPYTAVSPSESPLHFADRRDESVIVGYYTSAEVPSPRRRQPGAPLGELSVRRIHIAHRRCEQGFHGAQHPLAHDFGTKSSVLHLDRGVQTPICKKPHANTLTVQTWDLMLPRPSRVLVTNPDRQLPCHFSKTVLRTPS